MRKLSVIVLVIGMTGCASPAVKVCDMPEGSIVQNMYLVFDAENTQKLGKMVQDLDSGDCKLPKGK